MMARSDHETPDSRSQPPPRISTTSIEASIHARLTSPWPQKEKPRWKASCSTPPHTLRPPRLSRSRPSSGHGGRHAPQHTSQCEELTAGNRRKYRKMRVKFDE